ncbi:uncharacterized protein C2845_PM07G25300 [Panicum miliaceum]|uniref:WRKY domain-containing protein n=1 Tax=Panicum miliaceum TaxID=4540 RepID=A0A3L6SIS7_PANMI|nr:uncharacterized protein C2845_PM07G25300 [Panicum miliaceum]
MAFDPDAKLSDVLAGGYDLNNRLQALLISRPLDSRGQEAAMAFSQELSRVFMLSLSMLNSNAVAPEVRSGNSSGVSAPAKDKRARSDNGEVVTPSKKSREEGVTRKEITPSPHKDGYQWRKYGQKKIQNCSFSRYYFKCNRHRRCEAKKKVQQQDGGRGRLPPMFKVTYVNEHTCHELRAHDDAAARMASPWTASRHHALDGVVDTARGGGGLFDLLPHIVGGGSAEENEAMVSCLAAVVSGSVPSPPPRSSGWPAAPEASASDPAASFVPPAAAGRSASVADDGAMMMVDDTGVSWDPWWSFCPVEEAAGHQLVTNQNHHRDMHMDDAGGFADAVWPEHACGAWRRA